MRCALCDVRSTSSPIRTLFVWNFCYSDKELKQQLLNFSFGHMHKVNMATGTTAESTISDKKSNPISTRSLLSTDRGNSIHHNARLQICKCCPIDQRVGVSENVMCVIVHTLCPMPTVNFMSLFYSYSFLNLLFLQSLYHLQLAYKKLTLKASK